ncbi:hypothetical protein M501DRAFT_1016280 [Patellaria atrata CBS 101060]|uniref:Xylanolytic transcriptional activator regulatory domain-containing protein n=1 Tax=Patellaria atrata CBS 101060 TaxID=1346257 RepID=A0A9P4SAS3_9PEZI|nr:hypothetical protein M501DRAFT_1016280 [Patellaria atrata CBS 101060]
MLELSRVKIDMSNNAATSQRQKATSPHLVSIKIDRIEERLGSIEEILQNLTIKASSASTSSGTISDGERQPSLFRPVSTHGSLAYASKRDRRHPDISTFEGGSSLSAHSTYANEFLERAVGIGAKDMSETNSEMSAALKSLRHIVERQNMQHVVTEARFPHHIDPPLPSPMEMPPADLVLAVLRRTKDRYHASCLSMFTLLSVENIADMCKSLYFNLDECSLAMRILVNGALYYIFMESMTWDADDPRASEFERYGDMCGKNFEICLGYLTMFPAATDENIQALLLGASYAVEISKPSLCWNLISIAAGLCQTLGYHRATTMKNNTPEEKFNKIITFFWIYILDRSLSIRLGRAPIIQDYDVSLPMPSTIGQIHSISWTQTLCCWIKIASVEGRIYQQLYSPVALQESTDRRVHKAKALAEELERIREEYIQASVESHFQSLYKDVLISVDKVIHYSNLTLIYRAIPPSKTDSSKTTFSDLCISAARSALESHNACAEKYQNTVDLWLGYLAWAILHAPFTPYIIIFCHVISTRSVADLARLTSFVISLVPAIRISEAAEKLHKLCSVFLQVAKLHVEGSAPLRNQDEILMAQLHQQVEGTGFSTVQPGQFDQFNPYLDALGLAPARSTVNGLAQTTAEPLTTQQQEDWDTEMLSSSLGDWFSGNQYIIGLLEDDLSYLQPL